MRLMRLLRPELDSKDVKARRLCFKKATQTANAGHPILLEILLGFNPPAPPPPPPPPPQKKGTYFPQNRPYVHV
jgi:hypothetical protein